MNTTTPQKNHTHLAATEVGAEAKGEDAVGGRLVGLGELLTDVSLGDVGLARVADIHNLKSQFG